MPNPEDDEGFLEKERKNDPNETLREYMEMLKGMMGNMGGNNPRPIAMYPTSTSHEFQLSIRKLSNGFLLVYPKMNVGGRTPVMEHMEIFVSDPLDAAAVEEIRKGTQAISAGIAIMKSLINPPKHPEA